MVGAHWEKQDLETGLENVQFLELLLHYKKIRARTLRICAPLEIEDAQIQSMPDVSPPKWHLAHTTWFFENFVLRVAKPGERPFHPKFHCLFNSYYKSQGEHHPRPQRGLLSRPTLAEVQRYREHVDAKIFELLSSNADEIQGGASWAEIRERMILGLHHEEQHQELLLTDILHILGSNPLRPVYSAGARKFSELPTRLNWIEVQGGVQKIGWEKDGFSFDNERPAHLTYLENFKIASRPINHADILEFIEAGGYRNPVYWLSDGWDWVQREQWSAPLYWEQDPESGEYFQFTLSGMQRVQETDPACHLSYFEADAYARWRGARLPTEFEWERAMQAHSLSLMGVGQVWEWTGSSYLPYPGFRPFAGDFGEYNGKFMSGQMVLRGGSIASAPGHVRHTYRNFFPPSARWQFSGARLAL